MPSTSTLLCAYRSRLIFAKQERSGAEVGALMKFFADAMRPQRPPTQGLPPQHCFHCAEFRGSTHGAHNAGIHFFLYLDKTGRPLQNKTTREFYTSPPFRVVLPKLSFDAPSKRRFRTPHIHLDWGDSLKCTVACQDQDFASHLALVVCRAIPRQKVLSQSTVTSKQATTTTPSVLERLQTLEASLDGAFESTRQHRSNSAGSRDWERAPRTGDHASKVGVASRPRSARLSETSGFFSKNELALAKQANTNFYLNEDEDAEIVAFMERWVIRTALPCCSVCAWYVAAVVLLTGVVILLVG